MFSLPGTRTCLKVPEWVQTLDKGYERYKAAEGLGKQGQEVPSKWEFPESPWLVFVLLCLSKILLGKFSDTHKNRQWYYITNPMYLPHSVNSSQHLDYIASTILPLNFFKFQFLALWFLYHLPQKFVPFLWLPLLPQWIWAPNVEHKPLPLKNLT